jgi:predicted nuclease with TOPRIM domain
MSKVNRKAIEANLRNKLATQYKEKTEALKAEKAILEKRYNEMWERARKAEIERDELKGKLSVYEDWNRRLQEFMDMDEKDRVAYVENLRMNAAAKQMFDDKFGHFAQMLAPYLQMCL